MTRTYTLKRRAEQQAQTRRRIVEAAVDLHGSVGPAQTTLSMIAERAGVQRHTLYAHFPDERSLFLACSGLAMERDPFPDAEPWRAIKDQRERLRTGLLAIYGWYERNAALNACVLARFRTPRADQGDLAKMGGAIDGSISRGARSGDGHRTRRAAAAGAELLHLANAGARGRVGYQRGGGGDGSGDRLRGAMLNRGIVRRPAR